MLTRIIGGMLLVSLTFGLPLLALGLLWWGAWQVRPWAAPLVVGGLLWLDFSLGSRVRGKDEE